MLGCLPEYYRSFSRETWIPGQKQASTRIFYPRISFWDFELVGWAENQASLPSAGGSFSIQDWDSIRKSIDQLPNKKLL